MLIVSYVVTVGTCLSNTQQKAVKLHQATDVEIFFYFFWLLELIPVVSTLPLCFQFSMRSLFCPSTVTDELSPQRSRDQQLSPAVVPWATWHWWLPLQQQQQQLSWGPVCPPSPGPSTLVAGAALSLRGEWKKRKRFRRQDRPCGACGWKWGNMGTSARVTLPANVSCFSPAVVDFSSVSGRKLNHYMARTQCSWVISGWSPLVSALWQSQCSHHHFTNSKVQWKKSGWFIPIVLYCCRPLAGSPVRRL